MTAALVTANADEGGSGGGRGRGRQRLRAAAVVDGVVDADEGGGGRGHGRRRQRRSRRTQTRAASRQQRSWHMISEIYLFLQLYVQMSTLRLSVAYRECLLPVMPSMYCYILLGGAAVVGG
uniref:Uncharacterized protein n=1 Tax=Oryza nivara TaxID=4536 RepID=A0A0E0HPW5_ORYNI